MNAFRAVVRTTILAALLVITACAENPVYRSGMQLVGEGRTEEGLAQLELAMRQAPQNVEYRSVYYRQRDLAVAQWLAQAETARLSNDNELADSLYRRVLRLHPDNMRAKAGIDQLATDRRHKDLVADADVLLKKNDRAGATQKIRSVLAENPNHRDALAVQRRIDEARVQGTLAAKTLKPDLRRPISLDFREATLQAIFEAISRSSGVNYVFDRDMRPDLRATIQLKNKNIDDAVRILLVANNLEQKVLDEDTVIIYPNTPAKHAEYRELTVKAFHLANADVQQVLTMIRTILKTQYLAYDEKRNLLVMRDTPEAIRAAEKLVALQDSAEPEVMLELEVLEVSQTRLETLGVRWPTQVGASVVGAAGTAGSITLPEYLNRTSSLVRLSITDPALLVNFKKTDTDTNVLANPRIRVRNRESAKVHIGERVPVITTIATANVGTSESVSYLDVGLQLQLEPTIYLEDEVAIKIGLEVSNITSTITRASGTQVYTLGTRNAATILRLKNNETQILAGLIQTSERRTTDKVPGLAALPIVGRLFRNNDDNNSKTEIVLLITPRIVRNIVRPDADIAEFASGTDAGLGGGAGGARPPPPMQIAPAPKPPATPAPAPAQKSPFSGFGQPPTPPR